MERQLASAAARSAAADPRQEVLAGPVEAKGSYTRRQTVILIGNTTIAHQPSLVLLGCLSSSLSLSVFSLFSFWKHEASFKDLTKGKGVVAEVAEGALLAGDKPEPQARLRGLQVKETAFPKLITLQHPSCFLFARPPEPVALQTIPCAPRSQRTRSVRFFGPRSSGPFVSSPTIAPRLGARPGGG